MACRLSRSAILTRPSMERLMQRPSRLAGLIPERRIFPRRNDARDCALLNQPLEAKLNRSTV